MNNDLFTRELLESIGGSVSDKLAAQNVVTKDQALAALSSLSPVLLGGLKRKQAEVGESGLEALMVDAGASDDDFDVDGALQNDLSGSRGDLGKILDSNSQDQTVMALSQKLGVGKSVAKQLLPILAPIILSMLMKKGQQDTGTSTRSGGISSILDRDGDGSIIDDIAGMVLGGGQQRGGGGFFQMILSFFMRK